MKSMVKIKTYLFILKIGTSIVSKKQNRLLIWDIPKWKLDPWFGTKQYIGIAMGTKTKLNIVPFRLI